MSSRSYDNQARHLSTSSSLPSQSNQPSPTSSTSRPTDSTSASRRRQPNSPDRPVHSSPRRVHKSSLPSSLPKSLSRLSRSVSSSATAAGIIPNDPRQSVPPEAIDHGGAAHKDIMQSWIASRPSPTRILKRDRLLAHLSSVIESLGPRYSIAPFGSVAVASDGDNSDLDLTIADKEHPDGFDDPRLFVEKSAPYNAYGLARLLEKKGKMADVQAIPWAKVPVVKFICPDSGIEVDINCNNLGGVNNTRWLLSYLQLAPYTLRPLIHAVKKWASARNLNDPSGQNGGTSFSSYTLTLLCIAYLQASIFRLPGHTTAQPYLPNLQSPSLLSRLSIRKTHLHFRDRAPKILKMETTFAPISSLPPAEVAMWQERNTNVDVGLVVQGFFAFYAGVAGGTFDWREGMVSPLEGGFVRRLAAGEKGVQEVRDIGKGSVGGMAVRRIKGGELGEDRWTYAWVSDEGERMGASQLVRWQEADMVVRDPFELGKNCTQVINPQTSKRIRAEFARAETLMRDRNNSFIDVVCEPCEVPADELSWKEREGIAGKTVFPTKHSKMTVPK